MKKYTDVVVDYMNDDTKMWAVDAYTTLDPNESGTVVAWIDDRTGTVVYADTAARLDDMVKAVINEKTAEIKARLAEENESARIEALAREMALAECVFDVALEAMRCVPGLGDGTADSRAVFQAVYAAAKTLAGEKPANYPAAAVTAAMGVAAKFGGPASAMRIAVRDGERAELVRPLADGLELSANVDTEEGEFAVSVMSGNGTVNEMDLALVNRQETSGEDALRVRAYTDDAWTCGSWYANVSFDASVPVTSLVSALAGETVK